MIKDLKTVHGIVYVATGRPLPVGAAAYTSTLPQALLVGFGILAPHINTSQRQIDQLIAGQIQKSLPLKVLC